MSYSPVKNWIEIFSPGFHHRGGRNFPGFIWNDFSKKFPDGAFTYGGYRSPIPDFASRGRKRGTGEGGRAGGSRGLAWRPGPVTMATQARRGWLVYPQAPSRGIEAAVAVHQFMRHHQIFFLDIIGATPIMRP
jgi:hypothetical protein